MKCRGPGGGQSQRRKRLLKQALHGHWIAAVRPCEQVLPGQGLQLLGLCNLTVSAVTTCCAHLAWPPLDDQESVLAHSPGLLGVCQ